MLTFDPANHEYRWEGRPVPNVSKILSDAGLIDRTFFTDGSCQRGQYVAEATALDDAGQLDPDSLDPRLMPYVQAWREFRRVSGVTIIATEERVYHPLHRYAGTLDRRGTLNGRDGIFDIKTGAPARWHAVQLVAYSECVNPALARLGVYLKDDGRFFVIEYSNPRDADVWAAALTISNFKRAA